MKPFNLEQALAGKKVVTRNGKEVTQLHKFDTKSELCLAAVINDILETFTINGKYFSDASNTQLDLFMAPEKREYWVNVYRSEVNGVFPSHHSYPSEIEAKKAGIVLRHYLKTIKIHEEEV